MAATYRFAPPRAASPACSVALLLLQDAADRPPAVLGLAQRREARPLGRETSLELGAVVAAAAEQEGEVFGGRRAPDVVAQTDAHGEPAARRRRGEDRDDDGEDEECREQCEHGIPIEPGSGLA